MKASGNEIPTIHLGAAASQMEKCGIRTERGNINREIEVTNQRLRQLGARISKLQNWLKEVQELKVPFLQHKMVYEYEDVKKVFEFI